MGRDSGDAMPDIAVPLSEFAAQDDIQKALNRALRDLDKAKNKNDELVAAVYQAARDAASGVNLRTVKPPKAQRAKGDETAVVVLSDWQLGKLTPSYSSDICANRLITLAQKVADLTALQRGVDELRVYLLGDLVEGELIFPGQQHRIDASLFRQVMLDGPEILGSFLVSMLGIFEKVTVKAVIGNHGALGGRSRREYHPESNADSMLYEATRLMLKDQPRLEWTTVLEAGERNWYQTDDIRGHRFFMFHGDQVRGGFAGFPWYGFGKKLLGWHKMYGPFDYALSGHFHTPVRGYYNGIVHWGNGSTESGNTYAAENLSASGEPCQWLLFVANRGVTAEYLVKLD